MGSIVLGGQPVFPIKEQRDERILGKEFEDVGIPPTLDKISGGRGEVLGQVMAADTNDLLSR